MNRAAVPRLRGGFALVAAVVTVAVVAVLAAVILPSTMRLLAEERIAKAETSLVRLDSAIVRFRRTLNVYPGRLNHLAVQVTTNDKDSCGNNYGGGQVNKWPGSTTDTIGGAYISQPVLPAGLAFAGIGYMRDSLSRNPPGETGVLELVIPDVTEDDAILLNDRIDGVADFVIGNEVAGNQTGKIRWTAPNANKLVTLTYNVIPPLAGC